MVILVQKSQRPRRWAGVASFAVLLLTLWWIEHRGVTHPPDVPAAHDAASGVPSVLAPAEPASGLAAMGPSFASAPIVMPPPPEGLDAAQWQSLRESLKDHPQRDAEIARVAEYMAFRSRVDRWRAARAQPAERDAARQLAHGLLDGLPVHVGRRELSAGEAMLLQDALLETLLPEAGARDARRLAERQRLKDAAPPAPDTRALAERDERFQREQSALVAAWQAQPAAQRDPKQLEASIAALRRSIYDR